MDKNEARSDAQQMLVILLQSQPNLLIDKGSVNHHHGEKIASFCADFIDAYAERLMKS